MITVSILIQHHAGPTGDVLLAKNADGEWTFPSGKVRTNETEEEACERIAWEQLGMKITIVKCTLYGHKYPKDGWEEHLYTGNITHNTHTKYDYHNYYEAVDKWRTEPQAGMYSEFKWVHPSELGKCEFSGDDKNFMAKYDPWINGEFIPDVRMF